MRKFLCNAVSSLSKSIHQSEGLRDVTLTMNTSKLCVVCMFVAETLLLTETLRCGVLGQHAASPWKGSHQFSVLIIGQRSECKHIRPRLVELGMAVVVVAAVVVVFVVVVAMVPTTIATIAIINLILLCSVQLESARNAYIVRNNGYRKIDNRDRNTSSNKGDTGDSSSKSDSSNESNRRNNSVKLCN